MNALVRCCARQARIASYIMNSYSRVEIYFLDATENNRDGPTEIQKVTAARLTYEDTPFQEIQEILTKRLQNRHEIWSVLKSIFIIDYMIRCGDPQARDAIQAFVPLLTDLKESDIYSAGKEHEVEELVHRFAGEVLVLLQDQVAYENARFAAEPILEKIRNVPIVLKARPKQHGGTAYSGLSRSPQKVREVASVLDVEDDE